MSEANSVSAKYARLYELMDEIYLVDKKEGETRWSWFRTIWHGYKHSLLFKVMKVLENQWVVIE